MTSRQYFFLTSVPARSCLKIKNKFLKMLIVPARFQSTKWKWRDVFFKNGGLLTSSSVSQIFEFGFGTRVRSLPDALRLATPKKRLPGAGGGFLTSWQWFGYSAMKNQFYILYPKINPLRWIYFLCENHIHILIRFIFDFFLFLVVDSSSAIGKIPPSLP